MIREWAVENGHMRPESRGRIPGAVVDMWENRNAGTQTSIATPAPAATPTPPVSATPEGGSKPQGETAKPAKAAAPKKETAKEPAHA